MFTTTLSRHAIRSLAEPTWQGAVTVASQNFKLLHLVEARANMREPGLIRNRKSKILNNPSTPGILLHVGAIYSLIEKMEERMVLGEPISRSHDVNLTLIMKSVLAKPSSRSLGYVSLALSCLASVCLALCSSASPHWLCLQPCNSNSNSPPAVYDLSQAWRTLCCCW